jgi:hypothetical protein
MSDNKTEETPNNVVCDAGVCHINISCSKTNAEETKVCPKNCDPEECAQRGCDPNNCDPSSCCPDSNPANCCPVTEDGPSDCCPVEEVGDEDSEDLGHGMPNPANILNDMFSQLFRPPQMSVRRDDDSVHSEDSDHSEHSEHSEVSDRTRQWEALKALLESHNKVCDAVLHMLESDDHSDDDSDDSDDDDHSDDSDSE